MITRKKFIFLVLFLKLSTVGIVGEPDHYFYEIRKMNLKHIFALFFLLILNLDANASCVCRCVNGEMKPICQSSLDLPPICPPSICPLTPPSIAPLQPPTIPPLGTRNCTQQQVFNPLSGKYEWKTICR